MAKYMTRQRKLLLSYLSAHADETLSAQEIAQALEAQSVSVSAVYRNLAALEEEGKLRRSSRSSARELFYQYTDAECCRDCLHLSCKCCGRTFHMDREGAQRLADSLERVQGFTIDRADTVLVGLCQTCAGQKEEGDVRG